MDKKFYKATMIGGVILFAIGIVLILCAADIGRELAHHAIQANGGSMDTEEFMFIMRSKTLSFQLAGTVCSVVGGVVGGTGAILCGYKSN